jgi:transcriptional regulator with XRE-family HTH domain
MTKAASASPPRAAGPEPARRRGPIEARAAKDSGRVRRLQELLGLTQAEVAELLETSPSTLARRPLNSKEADRLGVLERLAALSEELVPRPHLARWLEEPKEALGGASPKRLLATESGRRTIESYLLGALDGAPA